MIEDGRPWFRAGLRLQIALAILTVDVLVWIAPVARGGGRISPDEQRLGWWISAPIALYCLLTAAALLQWPRWRTPEQRVRTWWRRTVRRLPGSKPGKRRAG